MNSGGGGDIDVESLSVTENGSYNAGEGKAYNPVIVNVQPDLITKSITANGTYNASADNADGYSSVDVNVSGYKISEVSGLPSPIATFSDGANLPMPKLKVSIEPVQEGSGDPSPTNVRPFSGWSAVDVTIQDDIDNPTTTETITIQLGDTYYGGKLDVVSGVLTVDRAIKKFNGGSDESWDYNLVPNSFYQAALQFGVMKNSMGIISNEFETISISDRGTKNGIVEVADKIIRVALLPDFGISSSAQWATWLASNPLEVVYELATPTTIQLTPTAVKSLTATNNLWADTGDVTEASYWEEL